MHNYKSCLRNVFHFVGNFSASGKSKTRALVLCFLVLSANLFSQEVKVNNSFDFEHIK